jgi:hypothetical protein
VLERTRNVYLEVGEFNSDETETAFWTRTRANVLPMQGSPGPVSCAPVGNLGISLVTFPNKSVEKIFSDAISAGLLEARSIMKLNHFSDTAIPRESQWIHDAK